MHQPANFKLLVGQLPNIEYTAPVSRAGALLGTLSCIVLDLFGEGRFLLVYWHYHETSDGRLVEVLLELVRDLKVSFCLRAVDLRHPVTRGWQLELVGDLIKQRTPPVHY